MPCAYCGSLSVQLETLAKLQCPRRCGAWRDRRMECVGRQHRLQSHLVSTVMPGCADGGFAINGLTLAVPEALVTMALPLWCARRDRPVPTRARACRAGWRAGEGCATAGYCRL